jgi:hypothetical protein
MRSTHRSSKCDVADAKPAGKAGRNAQPSVPPPMIMGLENTASRDKLKLKQGCKPKIWDAYDFTG